MIEFRMQEFSLSQALKRWNKNWPIWWAAQSPFSKWFPLVFVSLYWPSLWALGGLRIDHIQIGILILALSYLGPAARVLRAFLLPLLLTAILYDSQRFYSDYIRGPIHVSEPYQFDKTFFGISSSAGRLTPNEWWQLHTQPILDVITGFFYLAFIGIFLGLAAYFRFWLSQKGTRSRTPAQILKMAPAIMWSFFWVNMIGYSTYYWYAAAPPWYVALYGLGPARMDVGPNAAGCLRFDHVLGTHFFTQMYGRSADVFGAIPSLHVAYPLVAVYFALRLGAARTFSIFFFLIMCFSAVYLNHHYILDILWGSAYALLTSLLVERYFSRPAVPSPRHSRQH